MNEALLKAIVKLFSIVAKERITDSERSSIQEFLSIHVHHEAISLYMDLFDQHCEEKTIDALHVEDTDDATLEFVDDWSKIASICKEINEGLTHQQKLVLTLKLIELMLQNGQISERQSNLIFYIGQFIKIKVKEVESIKKFIIGQDTEELNETHFLIVDEGSDEHPYKSKHLTSRNLTGMIVILRIPGAEAYFAKYLGISALTLNGVAFRSRKVYVLPSGSTIRGNKIDSIYYSNVVSQFRASEHSSSISFVADSISFEFANGDLGLRRINLSEKGGRLVGLMGASGSGKSTLLSVLNGSVKPSAGTVYINGINIHEKPDEVEGIIGYVPQDDLLIEELTVFENLYYAARLCFKKHSERDSTLLVAKTLKSLGLSETKDLLVGSPLDKTISGGQRKRLNIGLELLRQPQVMFVDEPTSGLSSRDSENIMDLLKELSLRGKMVYVVIHQPSSDIFKMFDSLIILDVGGYQVYYGNPLDAVVYFKDIVNMVNKDQSECLECGNVNPEQIFNIIESRIVNEYGKFSDNRKVPPRQWNKYFKERITLPAIEHSKKALVRGYTIPSRLKQMKLFASRDVKSKLSNKQYLWVTFLEAPLLALFLAYLIRYYDTLGQDGAQYLFSKNDNIAIYFFMCIIVALFMGLTVSAEEIFKDRNILKRESFLNLSRGSYLWSKVLVLFSISAIQCFSLVAIGNLILEIKDMYISLWLILFTISCSANLIGLNISSAFKSAVTIYILIPLLVIPQLVLSGVVISFDKFNPSMSSHDKVPKMGQVMASRWGFEAAVVAQYTKNKFEKPLYKHDFKIANADYKKVFLVPELIKQLNIANREISQGWIERAEESLKILKSETDNELNIVGRDKLPEFDNLEVDKFTVGTFNQTMEFLEALKAFYIEEHSKHKAARDQALVQLGWDDPEVYTNQRMKYSNEEIANMVEGRQVIKRLISDDGKIIRRASPIFHTPQAESVFDFGAHFYSPTKNFAGFTFDTVYFNLAFIWFMTVMLGVFLYFDVLRKVVDGIGRLREARKYAK